MAFKVWIRAITLIGWFAMALHPAAAETQRIAAFGDSLSAGYELPAEDGFPAQLERRLKAVGLDVAVENAAVSGDTTSGGLERMDWSIPDGTDLVILELGGNDALRGIDPALTRANLDTMIKRLKDRGMTVILAGMLAPPNMGASFAAAFNAMYPELAALHGVALYPFFLDGVAATPTLLLSDGIHPNKDGVARIVDGIAPLVIKTLADMKL
jgi:acyl-CoA thioesterase I